MARFDVYRLTEAGLVVDCQADLLSHLKTRFVVPLLKATDVTHPMRKLNPLISVAGTDYYFCPDLAATVATRQLSERIDSLEGVADLLSAAIDTLLIGF